MWGTLICRASEVYRRTLKTIVRLCEIHLYNESIDFETVFCVWNNVLEVWKTIRQVQVIWDEKLRGPEVPIDTHVIASVC